MRILVCVKQVLASESELALAPRGDRIVAAGAFEPHMGRYDAYALEAALRIRESRPDVQVDAVTVGPPGAREVLIRALGMGADRALHVVSDDEIWDPAVTAAAIATALGATAYDLVMAGVMSEDLNQGIVGPALAVRLGMTCATDVVALELAPEGGRITATEELELGRRNLVDLDLPTLITVQSGAHPPRYPSLSGLLTARRKTVQQLNVAAIQGLHASQIVTDLAPPPRSRSGQVLDGSATQKAARLATFFKDRGFLASIRP